MDTLAIEPGGTRFAEAGEGNTVRIRDTTTLEIIDEFRVHNSAVTALDWHPQGGILASGSRDRTIRIWDVASHRLLNQWIGLIAAPKSLEFSPSGSRLASSDVEGRASIRELSLAIDSIERSSMSSE